jgi:hypothetical protein
VGVRAARKRVASALKGAQGGAHSAAYIETCPVAAQVALIPPPQVALHLIAGVEAFARDQAVRKAQRHRCIVGPLAGLQDEWPSTDHIDDRFERTWRLELHRRSYGVSDREAQQTSAESVLAADVH